MGQEHERIEADLKGLIRGQVRCDDIFLQMYASDASIYEIRPLAVVRPRSTEDVVAVVGYAAENQIPIHARGAGSGLAGESIGRGIVLDFSHSMRGILADHGTSVVVQPGLSIARLNKQLAASGRMFAPDPANRAVSTVGGVVAVNGAGSHWLRYGATRHHVVAMQMVLADGRVIQLRENDGDTGSEPNLPLRQLEEQIIPIVERQGELIRQHRPQAPSNRAGYDLYHTATSDPIDLRPLIIGSEGTLAILTELELRTTPTPKHIAVGLFLFDRIDAAARAALEVTALRATACDLLDRRLLSLAREDDVRYELLIPTAAESALLVETEGASDSQARDQLRLIADRVCRKKKLAFDVKLAQDRDDADMFWNLARNVIPSLYRLRGAVRPLPFVEDMAVPPGNVPEAVAEIQAILQRHATTASLFSHAGHGQIHLRPFLDLANPADVAKMRPLAEELYQAVLRLGGTISGEHALGLSRTWYAREQFGPLYDVFRQIKRTFDPENILNPGKIVAYDPQLPTENLRPVSSGRLDRGLESEDQDASASQLAVIPESDLYLQWDDSQMGLAARACNGCARCRTTADDQRMCPIFRISPREEATPRAKANLMRAVLNGQLLVGEMGDQQWKQVVDLCINCHQCRLECPAEVDIPRLVTEGKGQYVASNGLPSSVWALTRIDALSRLASRAPRMMNWALASPMMRWLLEKTMGIAQGRKLPRLAHKSFLRWAQRRRLTRPSRRAGPKVLYFVDSYASWYDVELGKALVAILEHNGVSVYVPTKQSHSAMPMISQGALEPAKRVARRNLAVLAEAVRQGYQVIATEPAAVLALTQEYPHLLPSDESQTVADNTVEACTYLWKMHQRGQLELDLHPVNASVAYHQPCHVRALEVGMPGFHLLNLIPTLQVRHLERGCSAAAGVFGLMRKNYRTSLRAGWPLISAMRDEEIQVGASECSTCKMQMEQGTTKPTVHPLKLLAYSYGLLPQGERLLSSRSEELIVT